jgi:hypothetical protein
LSLRALDVLRPFWWAGALSGLLVAAASGMDVTDRLKAIETPYFDDYPTGEAIYARNPWDLQVFDGRLYIGAGNSANDGPAPNAGPVRLVSYEPVSRRFRRERRIDDEQVDRFVVLGGKLWIPGDDARQRWDWGNVYRYDPQRWWRSWQKLRRIPRAIHVNDLAEQDGLLYAALGAIEVLPGRERGDAWGSAVAVSDDGGARWRTIGLGGIRSHALLPVGGDLYALDVLLAPRHSDGLAASRWAETYAPTFERVAEDRFQPRPDLGRTIWFPATELEPFAARLARVTRLGERALYLGAYLNNHHQGLGFGLYVAEPKQGFDGYGFRVRRLPIPSEARPTDILVRDERILVLLNRPCRDGNFRVSVLETTDLDALGDWRERLWFTAPTFARAFEELDGDLYFALGSEIESEHLWLQDQLDPLTGLLLHLPSSKMAPPAATPRQSDASD